MNKRISAGAVLTVAALYFFSGAEGAITIFLAVFLHELGHASVILISGGKIKSISFTASGLSMVYTGMISQRAELISIIMGPAFGIICGAAAYPYSQMLSYANFFLSAYNLLPALPLDGGRLLYSILANRKSIDIARKTLTITGVISSVMLLISGLYILHMQLGIAIVVAGIITLSYQTILQMFF